MTPDEQVLDMMVAELDRENQLLRERNERLEKEAKQRKPAVEITRNERMSYEDLEIDRDRMKTARDTMMLKNATLNANQRKPWISMTDEEMKDLLYRFGYMDLMRAIDAKLREKNQ